MLHDRAAPARPLNTVLPAQQSTPRHDELAAFNTSPAPASRNVLHADTALIVCAARGWQADAPSPKDLADQSLTSPHPPPHPSLSAAGAAELPFTGVVAAVAPHGAPAPPAAPHADAPPVKWEVSRVFAAMLQLINNRWAGRK